MAKLFAVSEKTKAIILMLALIVSHTHRVLQYLVRILDDNEVSLQEALEFARDEGAVWVGKWQSRGSGESSES